MAKRVVDQLESTSLFISLYDAKKYFDGRGSLCLYATTSLIHMDVFAGAMGGQEAWDWFLLFSTFFHIALCRNDYGV